MVRMTPLFLTWAQIQYTPWVNPLLTAAPKRTLFRVLHFIKGKTRADNRLAFKNKGRQYVTTKRRCYFNLEHAKAFSTAVNDADRDAVWLLKKIDEIWLRIESSSTKQTHGSCAIQTQLILLQAIRRLRCEKQLINRGNGKKRRVKQSGIFARVKAFL